MMMMIMRRRLHEKRINHIIITANTGYSSILTFKYDYFWSNEQLSKFLTRSPNTVPFYFWLDFIWDWGIIYAQALLEWKGEGI